MNTTLTTDLKTHFIGWQCRIRQYSVRKDEGRPSNGMRPELTINGQSIGQIIVGIVKTDSEDETAEFKFTVQKNQDPQSTYDHAVKLLSEYYYQRPDEFDEELTAVFSLDSELAQALVSASTVQLFFDQGNQQFTLNCNCRRLDSKEDKYQATYWHNFLFNPKMPGAVSVIGFTPDWESSTSATT